MYSEIPLLRPPKIKTFYLLKTLFAKFKLFFSSYSTHSVPLIRDHLWDCPKVVFKTTFGQFQRWSKYRNFTVLVLNNYNGPGSTVIHMKIKDSWCLCWKRFSKGFYFVWTRLSSSSYVRNLLDKHSIPKPIETPGLKSGLLKSALWFQRRHLKLTSPCSEHPLKPSFL